MRWTKVERLGWMTDNADRALRGCSLLRDNPASGARWRKARSNFAVAREAERE
jgi:hypothetical protein